MDDKVYLARALQERIRRLDRPVRPFVRDAVSVALDLAESAVEAEAPSTTSPAPPAESTPEEIEASLEGASVNFDDLGSGKRSPPRPRIQPGSTLSDATMCRFGLARGTDDDVRALVRANPRLGPEEKLVEVFRVFQQIERQNPKANLEWFEEGARQLGRPLTPAERVDLLWSARRRAGLSTTGESRDG